MSKLLKLLNGWKSIISYIAAQVFGSYPLVLTALNEFLENPKDPQKVVNFVVQLSLALGLSHKLLKNLLKNA